MFQVVVRHHLMVFVHKFVAMPMPIVSTLNSNVSR